MCAILAQSSPPCLHLSSTSGHPPMQKLLKDSSFWIPPGNDFNFGHSIISSSSSEVRMPIHSAFKSQKNNSVSPTKSMAEGILFNLAGDIILKLSSLASQQLGMLWGVNDELTQLKSSVSAIKAVLLDAEERQTKTHILKDWLEKLKEALYDAEDVLDEISCEAVRRQIATGRKARQVRFFFSLTRSHLMFDDIRSSSTASTSNHPELGDAMQWKFLHNLKFLRLENLPKLVTLPIEVQHWTALKFLFISKCPNFRRLPEWIGGLVALQELEILECPKLKSLPEGIGELKALNHLRIAGCPELEERCKEGGEDWAKISHVPHFWQFLLYSQRHENASDTNTAHTSFSSGSEAKHGIWRKLKEYFITTKRS